MVTKVQLNWRSYSLYAFKSANIPTITPCYHLQKNCKMLAHIAHKSNIICASYFIRYQSNFTTRYVAMVIKLLKCFEFCMDEHLLSNHKPTGMIFTLKGDATAACGLWPHWTASIHCWCKIFARLAHPKAFGACFIGSQLTDVHLPNSKLTIT